MKKFIFFLIAIIAVLLMGRHGLLDISVWSKGGFNLSLFAKDAWPPDSEVLPQMLQAMLETIEISFCGTLIGFLLSVPLAFFASKVFFSEVVSLPVKSLIGVFRTIPSILYGVIFVVAVGLGPKAGILAVAFYTIGYLAKFMYESFEGVDQEVLESVRACRARRLELLKFAVWPESLNATLSQLLFMFEYNIRASAIMGFVGAGGIGFYMMGYVQMLQYRSLATALVLTFAVVLLMDRISFCLRSKLTSTGFSAGSS